MKKVKSKIKWGLLYLLISCLLVVNKVLVHFVPFKVLNEKLSSHQQIKSPKNKPYRTYERIRQLILRAAKRSWVKPKCFEQSLTVLELSRIFKVLGTVHFGIMRNEKNEIEAHAWSTMNGYPMTGHENRASFHEVYLVKSHHTVLED